MSVEPQPNAAAEQCPDETAISAFSQGQMAPPEAKAIEAHLDTCAACRQVVVELVRIFEDDAPVSSAPAPEASLRADERATTLGSRPQPKAAATGRRKLRSGAQVGRYRVLDCVGMGGMGVVYAAYDPELDRRVALKLLRGSSDNPDSQGNSRLLREAQAMARLTHPNVITVHDVGTWDEQVVVAMEFVEGITLKTWLADKRSWSEVREVFVAAGRGLSAAHHADLVHRDFKPDNVLLSEDGRVRVTDFGLARWVPPRASDVESSDESGAQSWSQRSALHGPPSDSDDSGSPSHHRGRLASGATLSATRTGMLIGTPAYMSPEQHDRRPADAKSDQFAFCVALFEAVHGERPFQGRTLIELATNVYRGQIATPSTSMPIPRAIRLAIRRGLSVEPADRFDSMDELLGVIGHRRSRRLWPWAAAVGAAGIAIGAWSGTPLRYAPSEFCRADRGLDGAWDAEHRDAVRAAFMATELVYAANTADRTIAALDDYAATWESIRQRVCDPLAGTTEGLTASALRTRCLERRKASLRALVEVLERGSEAVVPRAVASVAGLPDLEGCSDRTELLAELPPSPPPEVRDEVEEVRDGLARAAGLLAAGQYREGLELARTLDAEATAIGHQPLQAETRHIVARMLDFSGEPAQALAAFEEAELLAVASRHRRVVARVLVDVIFVLGDSLRHSERAQRVARRAEAEVEAAGLGAAARAPLLLNRGTSAYRGADYAAAERYWREALSLYDRTSQPLQWADAALNVATSHLFLSEFREAAELQRQYVEVYEAELGEMHPGVADGYHNLSATYRNDGRLELAEIASRKAESIRRQTVGDTHPEYARTLITLGGILIDRGQPEEGLAYGLRAIDILISNGSEPSVVASSRVEVGEALISLGRYDEAAEQGTLALRAVQDAHGVAHPDAAAPLAILARVAGHRGDAGEVDRLMSRAHTVWSDSLGADTLSAQAVVVDWAEILTIAGQPGRAIDKLEGLLAELGSETTSDGWVIARIALATVLWDSGRDRARANAMVRETLPVVDATERTQFAATLRRWLQEHPGV